MSSTPNPDAPDLVRAVNRISSTYFMRSLRLMVEFHGGELLRALIHFAIFTANIAHLDQGNGPVRYVGLDSPPPDEERRPISILAISDGMGLPFETVRRHVNKLLAEGQCVRVKGGVIVPKAVVESDRAKKLGRVNLTYVQKMTRDLRRIGFETN